MLAGQRQMRIVEEVRRRGAMRVSELTELFAVSDMTIRRDLDVLAAAGMLDKVHGGATAKLATSTDEPGFDVKSHRQLEEKEAIARAAARLIEPGQAVALTAGTTTWRLAHHILDISDLTVVTNSIQVANVLHRGGRSDLTVVLTGGVRTPSDALVGPVAVGTIGALHVDLLFLGVHGMMAEAGFTTPNLLEAETDQALIAASQTVIAVADHTKWCVRGLSRIAQLEDVHVLVSDDRLPAEARSALSEHVGRVVIAPVSRTQRRRAASDSAGEP